jgi:hypothetical protein
LISVVAFGFAWWLGLYLLARDAAKPTLRRAGLGLLGCSPPSARSSGTGVPRWVVLPLFAGIGALQLFAARG